MLDEGYDLNQEPPEEEAPPPEESGNRTFLIVGGIFAGLIFLTLVCGAIYVLWLGPRLATQRSAAQATIEAGNAQVVQQMTSTAEAASWTATPQDTDTPVATETPIVAIASSTPIIAAATPTIEPAVLQATQTQFAVQVAGTMAALTPTGTLLAGAAAATAIPKTGFFDQVGLPGLIVLTLALIAVIILSRRLRNAPTK